LHQRASAESPGTESAELVAFDVAVVNRATVFHSWHSVSVTAS